jgi:PAS domain S-box-containing protein
MLDKIKRRSDNQKTQEELRSQKEQLRLAVAQDRQNTFDRPELNKRSLVTENVLKTAFGLALLLLGGVGLISYFSIQKLVGDRQWVEHTHQVLNEIDRASEGIKDAAREQRGYLKTPNDEFLKTHQTYIQTTQASLESLGKLTSDNPQQQQRLDKLEPLVKQTSSAFERLLLLKQSERVERSARIELANQTSQLRQQIEKLLAAMKTNEQQLLVARSQAADFSVRYTNIVVGVSYVFSFALLILILGRLEREIRDRRQIEAMVRQANADLESQVQKRTSELRREKAKLQSEIQERKQIETALKQSQQYLQAIFDAEPECVKVVTADGTLLDMNAAGLAIIEAESIEQLRGKCVCPIVEASHQQAFINLLEQVALGGSGILEFEIVGLKGTRRWLESHAVPLQNRDKKAIDILAVTRDITARKKTEITLKQAKSELESRVRERTAELQQRADEIQDLYNKAPCGYHSLDRDGCLVQINDTELNWLGYTRQEVLGKCFIELLTPKSALVFQENFPHFKRQGWVNNLEFELICKDRAILIVNLNATAIYDDRGNYLMSRSTLFDIRDRKTIEAALRDSETKFRSLNEFSPNGVLMTDAQGQPIYMNPRAQEICGCSFEETLGTEWTRFIHPDDLPDLLANRASAIARPQSLTIDEIRCVHKSGTIRYGRLKATPLFDSGGQLKGYVATLEDISEQRQIEQMKNEFVSIVSHELRTPLTAMRGSLGLLANGIYDKKPEKGKKMLQLAVVQTDRLVRLVSDILDLKRLESGQVTLNKQSCDVAASIAQAAETMRDLAQQNQITIAIAPLYALVWAAPDAIMQTLTNLLSNAIKFSPEGSIIELSAEIEEAQIKENSTSVMTSYVRFAIKDRGRGIPPDKLETIFEQFQQVDASDSRQKGGTGLGLAICRSIILQHDGRIWAESILGEGSEFYFTLPTAPVSEISS